MYPCGVLWYEGFEDDEYGGEPAYDGDLPYGGDPPYDCPPYDEPHGLLGEEGVPIRGVLLFQPLVLIMLNNDLICGLGVTFAGDEKLLLSVG